MKPANKILAYFSCVIILIFTLLTGACVNKSSDTDLNGSEWRIPFLIFLSGPLAGDGAMHKWLTSQVIADINSRGGIAAIT